MQCAAEFLAGRGRDGAETGDEQHFDIGDRIGLHRGISGC
jgi:hypothetical protein